MVKTKCLFDPIEEFDGTRIVVSGGCPSGISFDEHYLELAPSKELLYNYKYHGLSWEDYEIEFLWQMSGCRSRRKIIELAKRSNDGEVITLLCFEKSDEECHRRLLKSLIDDWINWIR